jgi:hypothetical protein
MQDQIIQTQLATIETSQLADVTGGGIIGGAIKLAEKAGPLIAKAWPAIKTGVVQSAKWTGIPTALGGAFAWAKHEFTH